MLVEIKSEAFKGKGITDGTITFHKGLNTIIADETANNSTGKSSFLLAIDFAFGGSSYVSNEAKIVENVGHHILKFTFRIKGKDLYFSRSTQTPNEVSICNSDYAEVERISLTDYCKLLAEKYELQDALTSFRGAISPYFRISHKSSKTLADFLKGNKQAADRNCIICFEKLFNRFNEIEETKKKADDAKKANDTFSEAIRRNYIPSSVKSESDLKETQEKIEKLKSELSEISSKNDEQLINFDIKNAEHLRELEHKYKSISARKTRLENKIVLTENSLEGISAPTTEELTVLQSFFPSVNVKKVYAVEKFHESLCTVLKTQLTDEIQYLKMQLNQTILDFESIKTEYEKALPNGTLSKSAFDDYGKKYLELQRLYDSIENFKKSQLIAAEDDKAKQSLNTKEIDILNSISSSINSNMVKLNAKIQNGKWKNPVLKFSLPKTTNAKGISKYSLESGNDMGDGTESANIMMFDLSVLKLSKLPAIAHDLFVRNELDDERKEDCIRLYAEETEKQIFTVFTTLKNYSSELQKLIEDSKVLNLFVNGGELYGTNEWVKN